MSAAALIVGAAWIALVLMSNRGKRSERPRVEWPSRCPGCERWRYVSQMTEPCCGPGRIEHGEGPYR